MGDELLLEAVLSAIMRVNDVQSSWLKGQLGRDATGSVKMADGQAVTVKEPVAPVVPAAPIDIPVSWQQAKAIIEDGSVEEMAKLGRNTDQLKVYRAFMAKVREDYASVADFIKVSVLERAVRFDPGTNKKQAVDMEHESHQCLWRKNDFPYNFEKGIEHWLLWCTEPLPPTLIQEKMAQHFPDKDYDTIFFVNPPQLQSVLAVWHCHVLVRPKGPA